MKHTLFLLTIPFMAFTHIGCNMQGKTGSSDKKILVAYFSHTGNTRQLAAQIQQALQCDIFEIIPEKPYPNDYDSCVNQAKTEIKAAYKPALKTHLENMDAYDVIFVGSPCWWHTIAPPVASFLAENDFHGKSIAPFMTHEGSGLGVSMEDIQKRCPGAKVLQGLPRRGCKVKNAGEEVSAWLKKLEMIK